MSTKQYKKELIEIVYKKIKKPTSVQSNQTNKFEVFHIYNLHDTETEQINDVSRCTVSDELPIIEYEVPNLYNLHDEETEQIDDISRSTVSDELPSNEYEVPGPNNLYDEETGQIDDISRSTVTDELHEYEAPEKLYDTQPSYRCNLCEAICISIRSLEFHLRQFHKLTESIKFIENVLPVESLNKRTPKLYKCKYCSVANTDPNNIRSHERSHVKPYLCHLCTYRSAQNYGLQIHLQKHHNLKNYKLKRQNYDSNYKRFFNYNNKYPKTHETHERDETTKNHVPNLSKWLVLKGKVTNNEVDINTVQIILNTPTQPIKKNGKVFFKCNFCKVEIGRKHDIKRHERTHIKPFICHICPYRGTESSCLTGHIMNKHSLTNYILSSINFDCKYGNIEIISEQQTISNENDATYDKSCLNDYQIESKALDQHIELGLFLLMSNNHNKNKEH